MSEHCQRCVMHFMAMMVGSMHIAMRMDQYTADKGLPAACYSMVSKRYMRLVTNVLNNNVVWYRKVTLEVHGMPKRNVLCNNTSHCHPTMVILTAKSAP